MAQRYTSATLRNAPRKKLVKVNARLFAEDVKRLKLIAGQKLIPWQTELRLALHRALNITIVNGDRE